MLKMMLVNQHFPKSPPIDIPAILRRDFEARGILKGIKRGARIGVTAGSRGVSNMGLVIGETVKILKDAGANPFVMPAMGSHGGGTPEGQKELLAEYGITEKTMGCPIEASMEVKQVGTSELGIPVYVSTVALAADGIVLVNRVKLHTDFIGVVGSGVLKISVVGLGKAKGANVFHMGTIRHGYEKMILTQSKVVLEKAPVIAGIGLVEDSHHQTARVEVMRRDDIRKVEPELQAESIKLMPKLPFEEIDLLIIDQMGKNISGPGMDPHIMGRSVFGYSTDLNDKSRKPNVKRLLVCSLTPESHGNGSGIGLADFTTARFMKALDTKKMFFNALTAGNVFVLKLPVYFDTDQLAVEGALATLGLPNPDEARVVRILDTLSLSKLEISTSFEDQVKQHERLTVVRGPQELKFDASGTLLPIGA